MEEEENRVEKKGTKGGREEDEKEKNRQKVKKEKLVKRKTRKGKQIRRDKG